MAFVSNGQSINDVIKIVNDTSANNSKQIRLSTIKTLIGADTLFSIGAIKNEVKDGLWINLTENCFLLSYEMYNDGQLVESCDIDTNGYFHDIRFYDYDYVLKYQSANDSDTIVSIILSRWFVGHTNGLHLYTWGKFVEVSEEYESHYSCTPLTKNGIFLLFENGRLTMSTRMKENKVNGVLREYGEFGLKKEFAYKEGILDGMGYIYFKGNLIGCFDYSFGILFNSSRINNKIRKEGFMVDKQFVPMYYYPIVNVSGQSAFNNIFGLIGPGGKYKPMRYTCKKRSK